MNTDFEQQRRKGADGNCTLPRPQSGEVENLVALRDRFAADALQGLVASNFYDRFKPAWKLDEYKISIPMIAAQIAYEYADAMLDYRKGSKS